LSTIGIYCEPLTRSSTRPGLAGHLYRHYRANLLPRNEAYMRKLFESHYADGKFLNLHEDPDWRERIRQADRVVLLYPDPIGFGFSRVEREVRKRNPRSAELRFLNGRSRTLPLSGKVRAQLALRRLLIRFFVFEALAVIPFFAATLYFAASDAVRGRK
jgi:hypothetical protein